MTKIGRKYFCAIFKRIIARLLKNYNNIYFKRIAALASDLQNPFFFNCTCENLHTVYLVALF
jgi:hypothetical protein